MWHCEVCSVAWRGCVDCSPGWQRLSVRGTAIRLARARVQCMPPLTPLWTCLIRSLLPSTGGGGVGGMHGGGMVEGGGGDEKGWWLSG